MLKALAILSIMLCTSVLVTACETRHATRPVFHAPAYHDSEMHTITKPGGAAQ